MFFIKKYFKNSVPIKSVQSFYFAVVFIIYFQNCFSQTWENTYGDGGRQTGFKMLETYDNGFAILGITGPSSNSRIFLVKTDVDGNILWNKIMGSGTFFNGAISMDKTNDGGLVLSGYTTQYDPMGAAFVLKLDACGEKQWCKIFGLSNDYDWARGIYQLADGNYIVLASYFGVNSPDTGRVGLMKLDSLGNILWLNDYSHYKASDAYSLLLTNDNGFLLSGNCYVRNPGDTTGPYITRTMVIKIDSAGNEQWNIPYGVANYFYSRGGGQDNILMEVI